MKFRALKECPQGQQPGEIFDAEEAAGAVLESVGAVERVVDHTPDKKQYKRRDLKAEDSRDLKAEA
jgi:hypothetical protein